MTLDAAARAASGLPLLGRTAVITGGSRGIGLDIAERFAAAGARVAICSRAADAAGEARLAAAAERVVRASPSGEPVEWLPCDVAHFADARRLHATVDKVLGVPDLLVNNAGLVVRARLDETSEAEWDAVIGANLKGTFNVTRVFLPQMRTRRSGRIINIASISGRQGTARLGAYCAAKHGVVGLTRALAEETREVGIQVNAICPGSVDTDMLAGSGYAPAMSAGDVATVAFWLATEAPAALTGACIDVFG
jgi:NAD(P)-dependent dehydrogenase (short-subunit alcohol dehydrogenase family)